MKMSKDNYFYKMDHNSRGFAVIINNFKDSSNNLVNNFKQEECIENYKKTFRNIGFQNNEIFEYRNKTAEEIKGIMLEYAKKDFSNCDCLIAVFLTNDNFLSSKKFIDKKHQGVLLHKCFEDKFKNLSDKPKIFFIDVCRGNKTESSDLFPKSAKFFPDEIDLPDMFFGWPSLSSNKEIIENEYLYSKVLCETINKNFFNMNLIEIDMETKKMLSKKYNMQVESHHTMKKSCFFTFNSTKFSSFTVSSISRIDKLHQGSIFEFMGHNYVVKSKGYFMSIAEPWVYDAEITSLDGGPLTIISKYFKTEKGAIENAFQNFIKLANENDMISIDQANELYAGQNMRKLTV